jgi:serine protease Do
MMERSVGGSVRPARFGRARAAAAGFGLGAALVLSPSVWAENPPAARTAIPPAAPLIAQQSFAPLVKRILPAVVNISVTEKPEADAMSDQLPEGLGNSPFNEFLRRFFAQRGGNGGGGDPFAQGPFSQGPGDEGGDGGGGGKRIALGSGFVIDPSGYVITNNHVVGEAATVTVILQNGDKYPAHIVGRDPRTDLAVLKIKADTPLPYVGFGDSSAAQVGDWVVAVGNPFGLGGTVTTGIISARGRDIHSGQFDDFLQIDAPINRGNSGGPTFNLSGQVIGINTAIYSPNGGSVGIGFAIPSNVAKSVVAQLEAHGKVSRGWLGVQIQQVTAAIAASLGLHDTQGAIVALVSPDSPGGKAGLKQGDVVLAFDGNGVKALRDLPRLVADAAPGSAATLTVWRDGRSVELHATLGEAPENPQVASASGSPPEEERADAFGMHFTPLTADVRHELNIGRDVHGVVIAGVDNGSPADVLGLARGDVVMSINQRPVRSPEQAAQQLRAAAAASPQKSALLLLSRHGVTQYVGIKLGKDAG